MKAFRSGMAESLTTITRLYFRPTQQTDPSNPDPSLRPIIRIEPRTWHTVWFPMADSIVSSKRQVPLDLKYIEVTDLVPLTIRKRLFYDFEVSFNFEANPAGHFEFQVMHESYFIPWGENPVTYEYEPTNVLGERLPMTPEELHFMSLDDGNGSLKKYGNLQEQKIAFRGSAPAQPEGLNIFSSQRLRAIVSINDFEQNFFFLQVYHTSDVPLVLNEALFSVIVREQNRENA